MRELSAVAVVGTIALAAATGTLVPLALAGGFSYATFLAVNGAGKARIKREVVAEMAALERYSAFLDRFLKEDDYQDGKGAWANARAVAKLRKLFPPPEGACRSEAEALPDWDALVERRGNCARRLEELKTMVESRVPLNTLAATALGFATFFAPVTGLVAIGYQVAAGANQARSLARQRIAQKAMEAELDKTLRRAARRGAAKARRQELAAALPMGAVPPPMHQDVEEDAMP